MKRLLFILLSLLPFLATAQNWEWVRRPYTPNTEASLIAVDKWGNVYGAAENGNPIACYDTAGNLKHLLTGNLYITAMTCDDFGHLYTLCGYNNDQISINGITFYNAHPSYWQYFLMKYDSSGALLWFNNLGNVVAWQPSPGNNIVADRSGNIYVTCGFTNNITLGNYSLTNHNQNDSTSDILITKIDSTDNVVWAKSFGGVKNDWPSGITVTAFNHLYITGTFNSPTLNFGNTTLTDTLSNPYINYNMYVAKMDGTGIPLWARKNDGTATAYSRGIATDNDENPIIIGQYELGQLSFGNSTLPDTLLWPQSRGYIVKYDNIGNPVWLKDMRHCGPRYLTTDNCNNFWITGYMLPGTDTVDGNIVSPQPGSTDALLVAGWNTSGSLTTITSLRSGSDDNINAATDCVGNLYVCADYNIDTFWVGTDTLYGGTGNLQEYMFVAKYATGANCPGCIDTVNKATSVQARQVKIYPNPANDELNIESPYIVNTITIINLWGQQIISGKYNSNKFKLNISGLMPGIYFLKLNDETEVKLIKE